MFRSLMTSRRFAPLFWCQFFSAFNDNVLKNALVFLIVFRVGGDSPGLLVTVAGALFVAPPLILSGLGGQWADRYDKAWVAQKLKLFEIAAALFSILGFVLVSLPLLFTALVLFSAIAALFSPVKYGMLPDQLRPEELPTGNALVEGGTFIAILLGTIAGGWAAADDHALTYGVVVSAFAVLCWGASLLIPATNEGDHGLSVDPNLFRSTGQLVRHLHADRRLWSLRALRQLVLAHRRRGADAAADPGQDGVPRQRGLHHGRAGDLLRRHRGGLRHRLVAFGRPRHPAADRPSRRCCSGCSRSTSAGARATSSPTAPSARRTCCRGATACTPRSTCS